MPREPSQPDSAEPDSAAGDDSASVRELARLDRMPAPPAFELDVAETIRRRSGGRFFGPRTLGDRVPFFWLAVAAFILALALLVLLRGSDTGSLRVPDAPEKPAVDPEAPELMPSPYE